MFVCERILSQIKHDSYSKDSGEKLENSGKLTITFPIVWNGLIEGRAHISYDIEDEQKSQNQTLYFNTLFDCRSSPPDVSGFISGSKDFPAWLAESIVHNWEDNRDKILNGIRSINIAKINDVASAFHVFLNERIYLGTVCKREVEKAVKSSDAYQYIGAVLFCVAHYRGKTDYRRERIASALRRQLLNLEDELDYPIIFSSKTKNNDTQDDEIDIIEDPYLKSVSGRIREKGETAISDRAKQLLRGMSPETAQLFKKVASITFYNQEMQSVIYYRPGDDIHGWKNYWPGVYFDLLPKDIVTLQEQGILRERTDENEAYCIDGYPFFYDNKFKTALILSPSPMLTEKTPKNQAPMFSYGAYSYTSIGQELLPFFRVWNQAELIRVGALIKRDYSHLLSVKAYPVKNHRDEAGNIELKINTFRDMLEGVKPDVLMDDKLKKMIQERNAERVFVVTK